MREFLDGLRLPDGVPAPRARRSRTRRRAVGARAASATACSRTPSTPTSRATPSASCATSGSRSSRASSGPTARASRPTSAPSRAAMLGVTGDGGWGRTVAERTADGRVRRRARRRAGRAEPGQGARPDAHVGHLRSVAAPSASSCRRSRPASRRGCGLPFRPGRHEGARDRAAVRDGQLRAAVRQRRRRVRGRGRGPRRPGVPRRRHRRLALDAHRHRRAPPRRRRRAGVPARARASSRASSASLRSCGCISGTGRVESIAIVAAAVVLTACSSNGSAKAAPAPTTNDRDRDATRANDHRDDRRRRATCHPAAGIHRRHHDPQHHGRRRANATSSCTCRRTRPRTCGSSSTSTARARTCASRTSTAGSIRSPTRTASSSPPPTASTPPIRQWRFLGTQADVELRQATRRTTLARDACVDPAHAYAVGISSGSAMTASLACQASDTFAGFGLVAGNFYLPPICAAARPRPIISFHGTADPGRAVQRRHDRSTPPLPVGGEEKTMAAWAAHNGCQVGPHHDPRQLGGDAADVGTAAPRRWCCTASKAAVTRGRARSTSPARLHDASVERERRDVEVLLREQLTEPEKKADRPGRERGNLRPGRSARTQNSRSAEPVQSTRGVSDDGAWGLCKRRPSFGVARAARARSD